MSSAFGLSAQLLLKMQLLSDSIHGFEHGISLLQGKRKGKKKAFWRACVKLGISLLLVSLLK